MRKSPKGRSLDWVPTGSGSLIGMNSARPIPAERIRCLWGVEECAAVGRGEEVASGEWRVTSLRKKQIPRYARNDNLLGWRRAEVRA